MMFKKDYLYNVKRDLGINQEDYIMVVTHIEDNSDNSDSSNNSEGFVKTLFPIKTLVISGKYRRGDSKTNAWKEKISNDETVEELGPKENYPEYFL